VIFILAILVALVVGVGNYVLDEARRKNTVAIQAILMDAVQKFYDEFDNYPADQDPPSDTYSNPEQSAGVLLHYLTGNNVFDAEDLNYLGYSGDSDDLRQRIQELLLPTLRNLPEDAFETGATFFSDGYGNAIRYENDGGLGGQPVLISAGADKDYDDDKDNIRSDGR
ncbi:MAG: hypothetical protein SVT52_03635, partial [Planctomycetota bacterium]|nr:hypothetical protein [Planctomycetota bacterium]